MSILGLQIVNFLAHEVIAFENIDYLHRLHQIVIWLKISMEVNDRSGQSGHNLTGKMPTLIQMSRIPEPLEAEDQSEPRLKAPIYISLCRSQETKNM